MRADDAHLVPSVGTDTWDAFVRASDQGHPFQLSSWAEGKAAFGWQVMRVAYERQGDIVAGAQVLFRRVAGIVIGYVPMGPLLDWDSPDVCHAVLGALRQCAVERGAFFLKVEPHTLDAPHKRRLLASVGYRTSQDTIQPPRTLHVDLRGGEDAVFGRFQSRLRRTLRSAERSGLRGVEGDVSSIGTFASMLGEVARRAGLRDRGEEYFRAMYERQHAQGVAELFWARDDERLLCGIYAMMLGDRVWTIWGGGPDSARGTNADAVLHWSIMRWAIERGAALYDMWGIPDEDEDTLEREYLSHRDGLWGVYRFKRRFGGRVVRFLGSYDLALRPILYSAYETANHVAERLAGAHWHMRILRG